LLELQDLAGLKSVQLLLLAQLLVKGGDGLLELIFVGTDLELVSELVVLLGLGSYLCLLLIEELLDVTDLFLFADEHLL